MKTYVLKSFVIFALLLPSLAFAVDIKREFELKVTDSGLYFDGELRTADKHIDNEGFEYYFGRRITPHGDCIKKYGDFLFLSWYMGGEENKNVMLSRLHIPSQTLETVKFPHTHVGYQHKYPHIGDSHNTIAVAVCPLDSTVHLLYDMHSYSQSEFPDSYFNYSVSLNGAADAPVGEFNLDLFKPRQTYLNSAYNYSDITYPNFFLNEDNELFVWFREGGNNNGMYKFAKYSNGTWGPFTNFSTLNAKSRGNAYNWGLYGDLKYINGKLRVGFLKRMSYNDDKYVYNNGFHYAYTNDPAGQTDWYNYKGEPFSLPLVDPSKIFFYEPGDVVTQGGANSVKMSSGADFTVTDAEAVHFITNGVKSNVDGQSKDVHAYKKAGDTEFSISTDFPGGSLYAVDSNQVYLISKNNSNHTEIYKAEGGTNNWEKLFTETSGISIEHSNVLIQDGKLFVYAMSKASGDARPIYIQMYDLGIVPPDTTRTLTFVGLSDGQEIASGSDLTVTADVGSAFREVSLWLGNTNLGTKTEAPYAWASLPELSNMTQRVYILKLVAKDAAGALLNREITIYTPEDNSLSNQSVLTISFEDQAIAHWETDGNDYNVTPEIRTLEQARSGAMVMAFDYSGGTSGHHVQNIVDKIGVADGDFFHIIAYTATTDIAVGYTYPTAMLGDWKPTPAFTRHSQELVFERKVTSRENKEGAAANCFPRVRNKAQGGACTIYYDDIVLYTSNNSEADLTAPLSATDVHLSASHELSWVAGVDDGTGVQATYIWQTTDSTANAPELLDQLAYDTLTLDSVGAWELAAILPAEQLSYQTSQGSQNFAVIHRDLAYNYSPASLAKDPATALVQKSLPVFKCVGLKGAIVLSEMPQNAVFSIYNMNGNRVVKQRCQTAVCRVALEKGIYFVACDGGVQKVFVR